MAYKSRGIRFLQKREKTFTTEGSDIELILKKARVVFSSVYPVSLLAKKVFRFRLTQTGGMRLSRH